MNFVIVLIALVLTGDFALGAIRGTTDFRLSRWLLRTVAKLTGKLLIAIGNRLIRIRI